MRVVRKRRFPIAALAVVMLLALGTIGLVYSNWGQSFTINGSVQTAEMDTKWLVPSGCFETEAKGKDIASATLELNGGKMSLKVVNGYPGFLAECFFSLQNNGKLPVEIGNIALKVGTNLTACNVKTSASGAQVTMICTELSVVFTDGIGSPLNLGEKATSGIKLEVLKGAEQNTKYEFQAQICVEAINTEQCASKKP